MAKEYNLTVRLSGTAGGVSTTTIKLKIKSAFANITIISMANNTNFSTPSNTSNNSFPSVLVDLVSYQKILNQLMS